MKAGKPQYIVAFESDLLSDHKCLQLEKLFRVDGCSSSGVVSWSHFVLFRRNLTRCSTGRAISLPLINRGSCAPVNTSVMLLLYVIEPNVRGFVDGVPNSSSTY